MLKNIVSLNLRDVAKRQKESSKWKELIDAILDGRVIPVIGPDFLIESCVDNDIKPINHHKQIIDILTSTCEIDDEISTFSQLIHNKTFKSITNDEKDIIYSLIAEIIDQIKDSEQLRPNRLLVRLLQSKLFPFVITTSFSPILENIMQKIWGDEKIRILQFRNDSRRDQCEGDITNNEDFRHPTVYYMFGRYSIEPHRYVVSDMDMMEFCKSWLSGGNNVPKVFFEALKTKYLLVLGNNYSDWLFRFIWFSMRNPQNITQSSMILREEIEDSLLNFLDQLQTFIEQDVEYVIGEIERRVMRHREKADNSRSFYEYDVFLSYSRRDMEIVKKLKASLESLGLQVWFDQTHIPDAEDWRVTIEKGIKRSRIFVPILSKNVEKEYLTPHEYRVEWDLACELAQKMGGRIFIWPLAEKGFDFYREETKLPRQMRDVNASIYDITDDFKSLAEKIKKTVDELKFKEESSECK